MPATETVQKKNNISGTPPLKEDQADITLDAVVEAHPGGEIDMAEYKATTPFWRRFHQHSLTQMMLLSIQAFCGPAMDDAIAGLGGGGLATPQTANTA